MILAFLSVMFEKVELKEYLLCIIFRFAKRKLDDFVFFGNKLQVSYAPQFESLSDTQDKLEGRRREVLARLNRKLEPFSGNILHTIHIYE